MHFLGSIISTCSFLLLLFSLHLFFAKRGSILLNRLLSVVLFARFGQVIVNLLVTSGQIAIFPFLQKIFIPLYYAAPICFYLYISRLLTGRTALKKSDWLHFIPVGLAIIHVLPWSFSAPIDWSAVAKQISENKQLFITESTGLFPSYFYYAGRTALLIGYLFASWRAVFASRIIQDRNWNSSNIWIIFILSIATFFNLLSFVPLIFGGLHQPLATYSWFIGLNCVLLLSIIVFIFHQPHLLYGYLFVSANWNKEDPLVLDVDAFDISEPEMVIVPAKNNLLPEQLSAYREAMKAFMENDKPFLQPGFQISHLAQKLDIPVHHCSFVINNVIGKNFRDWINAYRIQDFIKDHPLLSEKMTIEAIAYKSGFKSTATFYNAFKKETGSMPKTYFLEKESTVVTL